MFTSLNHGIETFGEPPLLKLRLDFTKALFELEANGTYLSHFYSGKLMGSAPLPHERCCVNMFIKPASALEFPRPNFETKCFLVEGTISNEVLTIPATGLLVVQAIADLKESGHSCSNLYVKLHRATATRPELELVFPLFENGIKRHLN